MHKYKGIIYKNHQKQSPKQPQNAKKVRFAVVYIYDYAMNIHMAYAKVLRENNIK